MKTRYPKTSTASLAEIVAMVAHFAMEDHSNGREIDEQPMPADVRETTAYICACFLAQNTVHGRKGVPAEEAMEALAVGSPMPFGIRVLLAVSVINDLGGEQPCSA